MFCEVQPFNALKIAIKLRNVTCYQEFECRRSTLKETIYIVSKGHHFFLPNVHKVCNFKSVKLLKQHFHLN